MIKKHIITSNYDNLNLDIAICPAENPKGIIQFSHGMAEHKERYYPFMEYLSQNGYTCIINDHRGHGNSIKDEKDLGFFYTENSNIIANDIAQINKWIHNEYPDIPVYMFSHSMGTLVARVFMQNHDINIDKLILCGPPTENSLVGIGIAAAKLNSRIYGDHNRSNFLNFLAFGLYDSFEGEENSWICSNKEIVSAYNNDPLCHYRFTANGFLNLFNLVKLSFIDKNYSCNNPNLPILLIAGEKDPVIRSKNKFNHLKKFLSNVGYTDISTKLYKDKRHELINEIDCEIIWNDILNFYN